MPDGSNLDAHQIDTSDPSAHAVEFSKTAAPSREGDSFADGAPERDPLRAGLMSIAPMSRLRKAAAGRRPEPDAEEERAHGTSRAAAPQAARTGPRRGRRKAAAPASRVRSA